MSDDEKLAEAVMEHLGPAALTGGKMSILEAFEAGWKAGHASRDAEIERERMRLIACGVIAMADTPESAATSRQMHSDYESGSLDAVKRRVDECIALRAGAASRDAEVVELRVMMARWCAKTISAEARVAELTEAIQAHGSMPEGFCVCSDVRDPLKVVHQPECRDLRAVLAKEAIK